MTKKKPESEGLRLLREMNEHYEHLSKEQKQEIEKRGARMMIEEIRSGETLVIGETREEAIARLQKIIDGRTIS